MSKTRSLILPGSTRRNFLKTTGLVAGTAAVGSWASPVHAAEQNTIKIALVGAGGRGNGAAYNALSTAGPTKLWAVADVFEGQVENSVKNLSRRYGPKVDVPKERQFVGFDAYKKAIDSLDKGDVVLLTTPPAFRPIHLEYAVQKGVNVFMEKSFAVDGPGVRRVLAAGKEAEKKNLKIAGGLMCRHYQPLEMAVEKVHNGDIGDVITCWVYREHGPAKFFPFQKSISEMGNQIRNYSCYTWLNGSFFLDWLIHNLDVACWVKDAWPVSAQGQGGRQLREPADQMFDHYSVEYAFADGTRLLAQGRHMTNCWGFSGDVIHGTKGCAVLGEGVSHPAIYKGYKQDRDHRLWKYSGRIKNKGSSYQREHDLFFDAIRKDLPYNETERCAYAAMVGILGRMAAFSGQVITWDEAMKSDLMLTPNLEQITSLDDAAPVVPDADGKYPIAAPGFTKVV